MTTASADVEAGARSSARIAAAVYAVVVAGVVAFQVALVVGAPWGEFTQGGGTVGALAASGRLTAAASAVLLAVLALGLLGRVGLGPWRRRRRLTSVVAWVSVGYGVVAVVLNAATPSARERAIWLPVTVVLLLTALTAVLGSRRDVARR